MAERARVHAIEAVSGFRPALVQFVEECRSALVSAEADAGRAASRIRADRYPYWKKQIRVRQDELKRAKTELIMKQAMKDPDEARSTVEERKAVDKAKRRVAEAEEKTQTCTRWMRLLDKEQSKFRSEISSLKRVIDMDMPRAIAELDRMALALEEYTKLGKARPAAKSRGSSDRGKSERSEGGPA